MAEGVTIRDDTCATGEEEFRRIADDLYGGRHRARMKWSTLLFRRRGATIARVVPHSFIGAIIAGFLVMMRTNNPDWWLLPEMDHPMAVQIFAIILSFVIVARTNLGMKRYFGGMEHVHTMSSRWIDSFTSLLGFLRSSGDLHAPDSPKKEACVSMGLAMLHWGSLAHALAINSLQCTQLGLDEAIWEHRLRILQPPENLSLSSDTAVKDNVQAKSRGGLMKSAMTGDKRVSVTAEGIVLEKESQQKQRVLSSLGVFGAPSKEEIVRLHGATDKVAIVLMWMEEAISRAQTQGVLITAPPVLGRCYAELGAGMMGFNSAYRIALVPFPFCFAQMIGWCLVVFEVICPASAFVFTGGEMLTATLTFASCMGFWGLNRIAIEIENPFGTEVNHLPMSELHHAYVQALAEMLENPMPEYNWDNDGKGADSALPQLKRNMVS